MADTTDSDVDWRVGQRIRVTCSRSKHYGRYGVVTNVYRTRLGVSFEDGRSGKFCDKSRAAIVDAPPAPGLERMVVEPDDGEDEVTELSRLLEHMAFTAATLISSHGDDTARVEQTLNEFLAAVRRNIRTITRQRQRRPLSFHIARV
jgi:hypothetical protein